MSVPRADGNIGEQLGGGSRGGRGGTARVWRAILSRYRWRGSFGFFCRERFTRRVPRCIVVVTRWKVVRLAMCRALLQRWPRSMRRRVAAGVRTGDARRFGACIRRESRLFSTVLGGASSSELGPGRQSSLASTSVPVRWHRVSGAVAGDQPRVTRCLPYGEGPSGPNRVSDDAAMTGGPGLSSTQPRWEPRGESFDWSRDNELARVRCRRSERRQIDGLVRPRFGAATPAGRGLKCGGEGLVPRRCAEISGRLSG